MKAMKRVHAKRSLISKIEEIESIIEKLAAESMSQDNTKKIEEKLDEALALVEAEALASN